MGQGCCHCLGICDSDGTDEHIYKLLHEQEESSRVSYSARETKQKSPDAGDDHKANDSNNTENGQSSRDNQKTEQIEQMKKLMTLRTPLKRFIKLPKLCEKLRDANVVWNGTIIQEKGTDFWAIKLHESWQNISNELVEIIKNEDVHKDVIERAANKAMMWKDLFASQWLESLGSEAIDFFEPQNILGLHISLGKLLPEVKPECIVEGKKINFSHRSYSTIETSWHHPLLIPGQRQVNHHKQQDAAPLMHCPTQWYFLDVNFTDFNFEFKFPPHISLACYGLKYVREEDVKRINDPKLKYEYGILSD